MKRALTILYVLAFAVLVQAANEVEITAEPHHHLTLQNHYVRVFRVDVPSGKATLTHWHRHNYVYVTLGDAAIDNNVVGKPAAKLTLKDGQANFSPAPFAHSVRTISDTPFRNVTIELLQDDKARQSSPPKWDQERGLEILNGGTQDILFVKDGVRVSEVELQAGAMVPEHRHPGPHLLVAVSDLELRTSPAGRAGTPIHLKPGDVEWIPVGPRHTLMNLGKQNARFVVLEFPR